ncbi:MAG: LysM peptidoglycan-binding domain-containing protein, partial [Chloroflexi bacterium]
APEPATAAPTATATPQIPPMPIPTPPAQPYVYHTVSAGETLGYISMIYDTPIEQLVAMNNLDGADAVIHVDQKLRVPMQSADVAPGTPLIPDSEVVFGPAFVDFDVAAFVEEQGGYLASYQQYVNNQPLTGAELVTRVATKFSVGPRLLLALLEYYGGWVTQPTLTQEQIDAPFGPHNPRGGDLYHALTFTANRINAGYYGYKRDGFWIFRLPDGSRAISASGTNAGTIGVQNILALYSDWDTWQMELAGKGMLATYRKLFGDPFSYAVHPLVPINLTQPPLALPWEKGTGFYFTSGPHGGFVDGSGWAAIDFGPPDVLGNCFYSDEPTTAVADGVVLSAQQGEVYVDLDGDGQIQTGWVLLYLHVALDAATPVQAGQRVKTGDVIGYASCEGGLSNSSHLHFARRYNGEWMAAGGPVPLNLDGWVVQPNQVPYEGTIAKGNEVREACECWDADLNLIINPAAE